MRPMKSCSAMLMVADDSAALVTLTANRRRLWSNSAASLIVVGSLCSIFISLAWPQQPLTTLLSICTAVAAFHIVRRVWHPDILLSTDAVGLRRFGLSQFHRWDEIAQISVQRGETYAFTEAGITLRGSDSVHLSFRKGRRRISLYPHIYGLIPDELLRVLQQFRSPPSAK